MTSLTKRFCYLFSPLSGKQDPSKTKEPFFFSTILLLGSLHFIIQSFVLAAYLLEGSIDMYMHTEEGGEKKQKHRK